MVSAPLSANPGEKCLTRLAAGQPKICPAFIQPNYLRGPLSRPPPEGLPGFVLGQPPEPFALLMAVSPCCRPIQDGRSRGCPKNSICSQMS